MALHVAKVKTPFREDGMHPVVLHKNFSSMDELATRMTRGTAIRKSDVLSIWEQEVEAVKSLLMEGNRVETPLGEFVLGMRTSGLESSSPDQVDRSGLHLIFHVNAAIMDNIRKHTKVKLVNTPAPQVPNIIRITNPKDEDAPDTARVGKVFNLFGSLLSFEKSDSECGVFFWNGGGRDAAVRAATYTRVGTARVDVEVPDSLPPGEYTVEIRTRPGKKELRTGTYRKQITITA